MAGIATVPPDERPVRKLVREISLCYRKFKPVSPLGTAPENGAIGKRVTTIKNSREGLHK
jgi:hypothetical protein